MYGGAQLAVKTLNTNYDLDIQEYITINFTGLEKVVNKIGGVEVEVKSSEIKELNKYIKQLNELNGGQQSKLLTSGGKQTLDGRQTVAYSRIRKVNGGNDVQRTARQRDVLDIIIAKLFKLSHTELVTLAYDFMPYVETSFSINEIVDTVSDYNTFKNAERDDFRYPQEYESVYIDGVATIRPLTLESNVKKLFAFIYEVEDYETSEMVREISEIVKNK